MWQWRGYGSSTLWRSRQSLTCVEMAPGVRPDGNPPPKRRVRSTPKARACDARGGERAYLLRPVAEVRLIRPATGAGDPIARGGEAGGRRDRGRPRWRLAPHAPPHRPRRMGGRRMPEGTQPPSPHPLSWQNASYILKILILQSTTLRTLFIYKSRYK